MVAEKRHGVFIATRNNEDCFIGVKHRKPDCEGPRNFGDATLPTFSENVKSVLAEIFESFSLIAKRIKW